MKFDWFREMSTQSALMNVLLFFLHLRNVCLLTGFVFPMEICRQVVCEILVPHMYIRESLDAFYSYILLLFHASFMHSIMRNYFVYC